jgi:Amt family ammonium transporter
VNKTKVLTLSEKVARLGVRLRDPEWRRYGLTLLAGKMLGAALLLALLIGVTNLPRLQGLLAQTPQETNAVAKQPAKGEPRPAMPR